MAASPAPPLPPPVFISVDTEEDNWGSYASRTEVTNAGALPAFQELCDRYGAVPTYLVTTPMAAQDSSRDILCDLLKHGRCEVGGHVHPWNAPPVTEETIARNSMLCNLPGDLVARKLAAHHALLTQRLEVAPQTFRAGRWGLGPGVAWALASLGYTVDVSVSPLVDWSDDLGPDYRAAPRRAYRFRPGDPLTPAPDGALVEIPPSIGFLGGNPASGMRLRAWALQPIPRKLRMVGVLDRLGIATLRWLSPELATGKEMVKLARGLLETGASHLQITFHSPTLVPGLTPFVKTEDDRRRFLDRIEQVLDFARGRGLGFAPLSRGPELLGL